MRSIIKILAIKNINNSINYTYDIIYGIIERINNNYNTNIITKYKYNIYLNNIDIILNVFKEIKYPFNIKRDNILHVRKKLNDIRENLKTISYDIGTKNIEHLIFLNTNLKINYMSNEQLLFINQYFNPYHYKIIDKNELVVYNKKKKLINNDEIINDINSIKYEHLKTNSNTAFINYINGCRIYIPIKYNKIDIIFICDGHFISDILNIVKLKNPLKKKNILLYKKINKLKHKDFLTNFIEQLSLRDFIINDNNQILELCNKALEDIKKYKEKTISSIVKEFLNMSIENQRYILTLFLLLKDDIETQYLAYLMYDMISNESYLLKPQPLAEQLYNSLHWNIQKLFKITIKKIEKHNMDLLTFNENEIPYDKRIALLKTSNYVKNKAMEKYKEIINKGNENVSKAQQYLDGLLKIPFNIYLKETIFVIFDEFKINFGLFINKLNLLNDKHLNPVCNLYNQDYKSNEIDTLITKLDNMLLINIPITYNTLYKNYKLVELQTKIKVINNKLVNKIDLRQKKSDLINDIITNKKYINKDHFFKYSNDLINEYNLFKKQWNNHKKEAKEYILNTENILNKVVYGQEDAKTEIKRIIAQWINGKMDGYCFGFEGPPGTGKTSLAKNGISKCLINIDGKPRPFAFIPLGGSTNGTTLEGHSYTYVGSTWGKIVDILRETQCMNPIIYIDELDKISNTENGRELIGILTHLTDSTQNDEFYDKYFSGIKIDLSKVLFIFSYNDFNKIDPILGDRIHRIKFKNLSKNDKIYIVNNYLMPEFLEIVGFPKKSILFENDVLDYIITNYTYESGIRKLKQKIFEIVREINLRYFVQNMEYKMPINITIDIVENIFSNKPKLIIKKISNKNHIGLVNGLYATSVGGGGITIIEVFKTPSDSKLSLTITGQQGDVMKESVQCAKTIAWNLIPESIKKNITLEWKNYIWGIHIHCPEAATPKEGPSAGVAITLAIISMFCKIPVKNNVALTGEIDLNGSVHVIGGLEHKIEGGKMAGVTKILYPYQNEQDIEIIKKNRPEVLQNIEIKPIKNIKEVIKECLEDNDLTFNDI